MKNLCNVSERVVKESPHVVLGKGLLVIKSAVNVAVVEETDVHILHLIAHRDSGH